MMQSTQDQEMESSSFEMPLNTVLDCLNIFGSAVSSSGVRGKKGWKKQNENSDHESGDENANRIEPLNPNTSEKHTGMRLTYMGPGYPLTLLMYMHSLVCCRSYLHLLAPRMPLVPLQHVRFQRMNLSLIWILDLTPSNCVSASNIQYFDLLQRVQGSQNHPKGKCRSAPLILCNKHLPFLVFVVQRCTF